MDLTPAIEPPEIERQLVAFLADYVPRAKANGVVLGLSGGVDSAVVAALAARALGPERVAAFALPHAESDPTDLAHARSVAEALGIDLSVVDITPIVSAVAATLPPDLQKRSVIANAKSRARMIALYARANATGALVLGTGNKSELLVGYFTKYGDGAADAYPLGDLYKTQVWALARHLRLPREVVDKAPSAGLFPGQTDEGEMGIAYADLDRVLAGIEAGHAPETIADAAKLPLAKVLEVEARVIASEHKRQPLVVPKVGFRTPGLDWRSPRHRAAAERGRL